FLIGNVVVIGDLHKNGRSLCPFDLAYAGGGNGVYKLRIRIDLSEIGSYYFRRFIAFYASWIVIYVRAAELSRQIFRRGVGMESEMEIVVSLIGLSYGRGCRHFRRVPDKIYAAGKKIGLHKIGKN